MVVGKCSKTWVYAGSADRVLLSQLLAVAMATWPSGLGKGLQSPVLGFDSQRRLYCLSLMCTFRFGLLAGIRLIYMVGGSVQIWTTQSSGGGSG
jgi:hypothetical protein